MTKDGWPVRRLKLIALINAMEEISDAAKIVASIWIEQSREGRTLEMSVPELTRRRGRQKRERTSVAIGRLERALSPRGWLVIRRPHTSRERYGWLRVSWPILAEERSNELQAAYDAAGLDPRGPPHPVPDPGHSPVPDPGRKRPGNGTGFSGPGSTGPREGRAHENDQHDPRSIHDVLRRNFGR